MLECVLLESAPDRGLVVVGIRVVESINTKDTFTK